MRLVIRLLGLDVLDVDLSTDAASEPDDTARDLSGGTLYSTPIGFTASPGDQAWERGVER